MTDVRGVRIKISQYGCPGLDLSPPLDLEVAEYLQEYARILEEMQMKHIQTGSEANNEI